MEKESGRINNQNAKHQLRYVKLIPIIIWLQATGLLKHWKKVRVELSGEGAGYDVTRGYNQAKVKTARQDQEPVAPLSGSGHCPLSLSEHVVACTRVLVLGRNSGAQQPAALHDIIIIPLLSPPIIYCTISQEIYLSPAGVLMWLSAWLSTLNTVMQDLTLAFKTKWTPLMVCE